LTKVAALAANAKHSFWGKHDSTRDEVFHALEAAFSTACNAAREPGFFSERPGKLRRTMQNRLFPVAMAAPRFW
jgi:hypothetical protein